MANRVCAGIFAAAIVLGCVHVGCSGDAPKGVTTDGGAVSRIGTLADDDLVEASGVAASARYSGIFWTHNDGDDGVLFAVRRDGSAVAHFKLDAKVRDWEDLARDENGRLFVADTGNNERDRQSVSIFELAEPDPAAGKQKLAPLRRWRVSFGEQPFNCEALVVRGGQAYLISKHDDGRRAELYRFPLSAQRKAVLERVATLPIREPVTAADLSGDGKRLAVLAQGALYLFELDGSPAKAGETAPQRITIPSIQAEGCCFADDGVLLVAESREVMLVRVTGATTTQPATSQPSR
jgi:hypothetical protein